MTLLRRWALAGLALLGACGGGGGGAASSTAGARVQVVVEVDEPEDLDEICQETGATVVAPVEGTEYWLVELPEGVTEEEFLADLDDDLRVVDAEHDEEVTFPEGGGSTIPLFGDDPLEEVGGQPALAKVGAPAAHARADGAGLLVAVVDTGVVASHPLLAGRIAPGGRDFVAGDADPSEERNFVDDDQDGQVDEGYGHGTFAASLVLAAAPGARILPLRALNSDAVGTASTVAQAIAYAVSQGARVVNLSAGLPTDLRMIQQAVANARAAGVLVVAAAGNRSGPVDYPAALSECEAVTATDLSDRRAPFASFGSAVDLCAPGVDLVGAHPLGFRGTARWSGTSFSTAIVAGAAAVVLDRFPAWNEEEARKHLEDTSVPVDAQNPAYEGRLGHGRLDLDAATR